MKKLLLVLLALALILSSAGVASAADKAPMDKCSIFKCTKLAKDIDYNIYYTDNINVGIATTSPPRR